MKRFYMIFTGIFLLSSSVLWSQITYTHNDLLKFKGTTQSIFIQESESVNVNLGQAGENKTWDFRSFSSGNSLQGTYEFSDTNGSPYEAQFPQANFLMKITSPQFGDGSGLFYSYLNVQPDQLETLGYAYDQNGTPVIETDTAGDKVPMPLTFGTTWNTTTVDTVDFGGFGLTIDETTTKNTIDGWGTLRVPAGDFECLRWRQESTTVTKTVVGGQVVPTLTISDITYNWISKESFYLATVTSLENETNPNFTTASYVEVLGSVTTAVDKKELTNEKQPDSFKLMQNYPNPFNPETEIRFYLAHADRVALEIFNVQGKKIATLVQESLPAGVHAVPWTARDNQGNPLPSGIYIYTLTGTNFSKMQKMTMIR